jgi:ribosomal protein S18 acetylase RimI-like enzyme
MTDNVTIREARLDDADIIAQFNCALSRETEDGELDLATVTRGVTRFLQGAGAGFYTVAEVDGRVVGCLMITHEWSDWRDGNLWWIQSVYVLPEARRRGVFRALFNGVYRSAEADPDVRGIRLYVERDNERAQRTYESFGMTQKPYRIYEILVDSASSEA